MAKSTAINYKGHQINIVDTPGHSDFGGEVERIMTMVDAVILLVCATEGPMTQTKYVLKKAIQANLKPIVVINKVDRPTQRTQEVENEVFDLFLDIDQDEKFIDYPIFYASGREGWATKDQNDIGEKNVRCILDAIIDEVPHPVLEDNQPNFSMLVSQIDYSDYFGKLIRGKINSGTIESGQSQTAFDQQNKEIQTGKVSKIFKHFGLSEREIKKASVGEIITLAGQEKATINSVLVDTEIKDSGFTIKGREVDPPLQMIKLKCNESPFAGKEGDKLTFAQIKERLEKEGEIDAALRIDVSSNFCYVYGRGDLHLGILFEKLRREGFEFELSSPTVVTKEGPNGEELQPIEELRIEINVEYIPDIMEKFLHRKGYVTECHDLPNGNNFMKCEISSKGMIGLRSEIIQLTKNSANIETQFLRYDVLDEEIVRQTKGSLVSTADGIVSSYALKDLEKLGALFVKPGNIVYTGQLVGECNDEKNYDINVCKLKELTNMRTSLKEEKVRLSPPRTFSLEEAISYIRDEEVLECTPKNIRIRKIELDGNIRRRQKKQQAKKR